jgi:hypothetical protein
MLTMSVVEDMSCFEVRRHRVKTSPEDFLEVSEESCDNLCRLIGSLYYCICAKSYTRSKGTFRLY